MPHLACWCCRFLMVRRGVLSFQGRWQPHDGANVPRARSYIWRRYLGRFEF